MSAGMLTLAVLLVAIGGAIGSLGRWAIVPMGAGMLTLAVLLVAIGGAIGSLGRWAIAEYGRRLVVHHRSRVDAVRIAPWLTVLANMVACCLLGIVVAMTGSATGSGELIYLLLTARVRAE